MNVFNQEVELMDCPTCNGSGSDLYTGEDCPDCCGTGFQPTIIETNGRPQTTDEYITMIRESLKVDAQPKDLLEY